MQFPPQYKDDLQIAQQMVESVNKTHKSLGKLTLMMTLADIANKCLLIVGCSGTGKSSIMKGIHKQIRRNPLFVDCITVSGLQKLQELLNGANMSVLIDDLSKGQTTYSEIATVVVFAELTYTGFFRKITGTMQLEIEGFKGSCIINSQPLLLQKVINCAEFETDIRDKCIRFYHLHFPSMVNLGTPIIEAQIPVVDVKNTPPLGDLMYNKLWFEALNNFEYEFTKARAQEHLIHLIWASTFFNKRNLPTEADLWLICELSKSFKLELELFRKNDLEGERQLDVNVIPLMSAINSWHNPTIKDMCQRFCLKPSRLYQILVELHEFCRVVEGTGKVMPTQYCIDLLTSLGEWQETKALSEVVKDGNNNG